MPMTLSVNDSLIANDILNDNVNGTVNVNQCKWQSQWHTMICNGTHMDSVIINANTTLNDNDKGTLNGIVNDTQWQSQSQ